jgi:hypothetical protein
MLTSANVENCVFNILKSLIASKMYHSKLPLFILTLKRQLEKKYHSNMIFCTLSIFPSARYVLEKHC